MISGINLRLTDNRFDGNYYGISVAPTYQGPEYILYNSITNAVHGGFKFSLSGTGHTWICHNTVTSRTSGTSPVWPTGPYSNMHFRNNILVGNGLPAVNDDAGESQSGNDFDGDLIHSSTGTLFRWRGVNYSQLSTLSGAVGFETRGRSGDPMFTSAGSGDYTLRSGSPAIDAGIRLPGINDRFRGGAPDIGAFETGADGPDLQPPAAIQDLSVSH